MSFYLWVGEPIMKVTWSNELMFSMPDLSGEYKNLEVGRAKSDYREVTETYQNLWVGSINKHKFSSSVVPILELDLQRTTPQDTWHMGYDFIILST